MNPIPLAQIALQLNPLDPLAIARGEISAGTQIALDHATSFTVQQTIPAGHKLALQPIAPGQEVLRYGSRIGVVTQAIAPGDWIHSHNLSVGEMGRDFSYQLVATSPQAGERTFQGYLRPSGQAGTRNLIAVVATVNCSAHVAQGIASAFTPEMLATFPNVDGVVAVTHDLGCCEPLDGLAHRYLQRALLNLASHPNIGGAIYISLGCEGNQMAEILAPLQALSTGTQVHPRVGPLLVIQEQGGIAKTVAAGVDAVRALLPQVNVTPRQAVPLSALMVALQCGGSDSWSGVTANPLVGLVADRIVAEGGTVVLAETPEIYGAEQLLTRRVASAAVGEKLIERLKWWEDHARQQGFSLDNNPSPGNKAGGLTTIYEKSLGAVAKGGSTPLMQVVEYAESVTAHGLVFMDTPGYDPVGITGQVAGGCNLTLFTTGRGSVFGGGLAPCVKVATNEALYQRMEDDMDFNAGAILAGKPMAEAAQELFEQVLMVASGGQSKSERSGYRPAEFVPWHLGGML
jgi:altronate hydrolase